jgi:hypothetical protein
MNQEIQILLRGLFLSVIYLSVTTADDMSLLNILKFSIFYLMFIFISSSIGIDQNVVTSAFTTKIIFTLIDQRINKNREEKK